MISINITLLVQMASFLVLLILMNQVLYKPIRRFLAERKAFVDARQADIDGAEAQVSAAIKEIESRIVEARNLGRQKIQEQKAAAYEQEKGMLQKAGENAAKELQDVRGRIQEDVGLARKDLQQHVQQFSVELAQKILGRSL